MASQSHEWGNGINWDDINFSKSYDKVKAYGQSKLANILYAKELARRLENCNVNVYCLHPGNTEDTNVLQLFEEVVRVRRHLNWKLSESEVARICFYFPSF